MPGLQFRPGRVCFNSLRGGDVLVPPADVLKGPALSYRVAFGGELDFRAWRLLLDCLLFFCFHAYF